MKIFRPKIHSDFFFLDFCIFRETTEFCIFREITSFCCTWQEKWMKFEQKQKQRNKNKQCVCEATRVPFICYDVFTLEPKRNTMGSQIFHDLEVHANGIVNGWQVVVNTFS